jgi:hypothetical protein
VPKREYRIAVAAVEVAHRRLRLERDASTMVISRKLWVAAARHIRLESGRGLGSHDTISIAATAGR